MAQWSRICLPIQGSWLQSLAWKDPICYLQSNLAYASQLLSLCSMGWKLQRLSPHVATTEAPHALELVLLNKRHLSTPPQEEPLLAIARESPCPAMRTPWNVARQAPPSMGSSRREYWSGLPFPSPGESSRPRDRTQVSCIAGRLLTR